MTHIVIEHEFINLPVKVMDYQMMCEIIVRKIFQCGRFGDPLGIANTDRWHATQDFETQKCQAWVIISRLQNQYLDSLQGREVLLNKSFQIKDAILNANTIKNIYNSMIEINSIVDQLEISEFPHIDYKQTNDKI